MKIALKCFCFYLLFMGVVFAQVPDPVVYLDFEEGSGTTVENLGTKDIEATVVGDSIIWSEGAVGPEGGKGCMQLLGTNSYGLSYVEVPYIEELDSPTYTISMWVKHDISNGYYFWANGAVWEPEIPARHIDLWLMGWAHSVECILQKVDGEDFWPANYWNRYEPYKTRNSIIDDGVWHHLAYTLDNTIYKLYIDGVLSNTDTSDAAIIENGVDPLWIGARPDTANGHTALKMVGSFDRFRFWDKALTEEQLNEVIANDPLATQIPDPVVYLDFEEGSGTTVENLGTRDIEATVVGDSIIWSEGAVGPEGGKGCMQLLGTNSYGLSYVEVPYIEELDSPTYTISMWVKHDISNGYYFWANGPVWEPEIPARHIDLWLMGWAHSVECILQKVDGEDFWPANYWNRYEPYKTRNSIIDDGAWHHLAYTLDNTIYRLYIDGVLSNTDTSDAAIIENGVDPLWIGARPDTANGHTALKMVGSFDRFRFWDRVLSEEEINDVIANDPLLVTFVDKPPKIVSDFALAQNYPNPFNPTTTIHFSIDKNQHTRLVIYDILGREIKRLVDNVRQSGRYTVQWDGTNNQGQPVASGVYFYRLSTPERTKIHKMMLLK